MKHLILLTLTLLLLSQHLQAQDTIVASENLKGHLGKYTSTFQDPYNKYTLQQLIFSPQLFNHSSKPVINFGANNYNNWVRLYLKNNSTQNKLFLKIDYPDIDKVSLYIIRDGGIDSIIVTEETERYKAPFYILPIVIPKGNAITCFLKFNSDKQIIVPIQIEKETDIQSSLSIENAVSGIYLGIMLAMILYNLFIFFSSRDKHYIYYCNYIFWVTLTQALLLGFSHYSTILNSSIINSSALTLAGAMSGIATIVFVKSFLRIRLNARKYLYVLNSIIYGDILAILVLFMKFPTIAYNIVNIVAGVGSLVVLFVAVKVYRMKYKPARYFLFGWVFFLGSVIVFVLKDVDVLPYNLFTERSVQIGSVLEALLLSFALADKLNILKKENEKSQLEALRTAKENERIILEQNTELEIRVNARTAELKQSNSNLEMAMENLKQAESQLVESEKMASLGQLTAGIAHEINNPINFVTSNVSPLRRDISELFNALDYIEDIALSEITTDKKSEKINDYKDEQEIDYLRTEITHLINGISNGAIRTAEIVKGLRIFSRLDEDSLKYASVTECIDSAIIIINNQLGNIIIKRDYDALPLLECYPGKLNQVFLNILSNAIYAIHKHFENRLGGEISIKAIFGEQRVTISIKDNGIGMDERTKTKIFDPFFTTKDVGEGTGLGMSIVYRIIERHYGSININSFPDKGSEFIITLPIHNNYKTH